MLNGFPAVNHGVYGCRQIIENLDIPVQVRHGTPDARLLTEICYAGGFTSYEGGGISYNIPYAKDVPLERTIYDWQYVDRLTGIYEEAGVSINREPYGPLTGTLVPPSMSNAVAIIEALLAAEQGVKNVTVGYGPVSYTHLDVYKRQIEHIKNGVVTGIECNYMGGKVGKAISQGILEKPVIFRTHGGRAGDMENGSSKIDIAFLAAPTADRCV